jgi:hypothetical protein
MRKLLILVLSLLLMGAKPISNGPEPLTLETVWKSVACNVEQQTIRWYGTFNPSDPCPSAMVVNNPTTCGWDIDDSWTMRDGSGSLNTGQVTSASFCVISDGTHKAPIDASVSAKHDKLLVRLDASDGRSWSMLPVRVNNEYRYIACGDNFLRAPHPEIPGSNGGQGTLVTYTLTIDATVRGGNGISAILDYGQGIWNISGC